MESINPNSNKKEKFGLTAGEWGNFLNCLYKEHSKNSNDDIYIAIMDVLKEYILNENGIEAINNGEFAKIFDQDTIIKRYRNPPAHTRYVTLDVARECKQYVENKLLFLEGLFK